VPLRAIALNCTLKTSPATSSTDVLLGELCDALRKEGVEVDEPVRVVDLDIRSGVTSDEGDGDAWPDVCRRILDADILVLGTPVWMGQPSSVAKRVLERLDALLD
jgi:multimeric flavodoxin WrbA